MSGAEAEDFPVWLRRSEVCSCGRPMAYQGLSGLGYLLWACYACKVRSSRHKSEYDRDPALEGDE